MMTLPTSPKEAIAAGHKTYFTGKPCKNGHNAIRYVANRHCSECNLVQFLAWRSTPRGRAADCAASMRYQRTPQGKAKHAIIRERFMRSQNGIAMMKKYRASAHGKATYVRCSQRQRARRRGVFTFRVVGDFEKLCEQWNYECAYCHTEPSKLTEDHIIPISWGGADAPWNIVPACGTCNSKKGPRVWVIDRR